MNQRKTETLTLAGAMDVLAREIQSGDGIANAAIAEAAERLRSQELEIGTLTMRLRGAATALKDAISTYRHDDKTVLVSAERQEAWIAALKRCDLSNVKSEPCTENQPKPTL
jgi:ethanolamine ammonia-lyase large subunit